MANTLVQRLLATTAPGATILVRLVDKARQMLATYQCREHGHVGRALTRQTLAHGACDE